MTEDIYALIQHQREDTRTIQELREQIAALEEQLEFWKRKHRRAAETIRRIEGGEL